MKKFLNITIPILLFLVFVAPFAAGVALGILFPTIEIDESVAYMPSGYLKADIDMTADYDGDGLDNRTEQRLGTSFYSLDTDGDGLSDRHEHLISKTNPNKADSDGDGLLDGVEITLGLDPLKKDSLGDKVNDGERMLDYELEDGKNAVGLSLYGKGNLSLAGVISLDNLVGGSIKKMIQPYTSGQISSADIIFDYSALSIANEDDLKIASFNPSNYRFTAVTCTLDRTKKLATATVTSFGYFALIEGELPERLLTDVMLVVQNSASLYDAESGSKIALGGDPPYQSIDYDFGRLTLATDLVDTLGTNGFRFGVSKFSFSYSPVLAMSADASAIKTAISSISTSPQTFDGVYIGEALHRAAEQINAGRGYIVLLSTGNDSGGVGYSATRLTEAITLAKTKGIRVITVGIGASQNGTVLRTIASETGGIYYNGFAVARRELSAALNFGHADLNGDGTIDSRSIASSHFVPSRDAFAFGNFAAVGFEGGFAYAMSEIARQQYEGKLRLVGTSYNLSTNPILAAGGKLSELIIDDRLLPLHSNVGDLLNVGSDNGVYMLSTAARSKLDAVGYSYVEKITPNGRHYQYPLLNTQSTKYIDNVALDTQNIINALQTTQASTEQGLPLYANPTQAYEKMIGALADDRVVTLYYFTHAFIAFSAHTDMADPTKTILSIYDPNMPSKINFLTLQKTVTADGIAYNARYGDQPLAISVIC